MHFQKKKKKSPEIVEDRLRGGYRRLESSTHCREGVQRRNRASSELVPWPPLLWGGQGR